MYKMKRLFILIGMVLAMNGVSLQAEEPVWCMVTDSGIAIQMDQVVCLVAADDESTFGIVLHDGSVMDKISRVTFAHIIPTVIKGPQETTFRVNRDLGIEGVAPNTPIGVYDVSGKLRMKGTAGRINLTVLPDGIYIIQINNTSFKIRKQYE